MNTNHKRALFEFLFISAMIISVSFTFQPTPLYAEDLVAECQVVRIYGGTGVQAGLRIDSDNLTIQKGTCIVWINWAKLPEINLDFENGKKCMEVTQAGDDFKLDTDANCLTTNFIGLGQTASLRFIEAGTYNYTVSGGTGDKRGKINGKIIVQ
jgi:hypothetical protein